MRTGRFIGIACVILCFSRISNGQNTSSPGGHFGWCYFLTGPCLDTGGQEPHVCLDEPDPSPVATPDSRVCTDDSDAEVLMERMIDAYCSNNGTAFQVCFNEHQYFPCISLVNWSCGNLCVQTWEMVNGVPVELIEQTCSCVLAEEDSEPTGYGVYSEPGQGSMPCPISP